MESGTVEQEDAEQRVFEALRAILKQWEPQAVVAKDKPDVYYLNTTTMLKNKQPLFFAAVFKKKNYISYHLVGLYYCPALLESLSPELKQRMQGKACFNFKRMDSVLFAELERITQASFNNLQTAPMFQSSDATGARER